MWKMMYVEGLAETVSFLFSTDDGTGEQQDDSCFVGQRSGRVIRPMGTSKTS